MANPLLAELNQEHLCTHYVLPLIGLSKFNFPPGNFINSFLAAPGREGPDWHIAVRVLIPSMLSRNLFRAHPQFRGTRRDDKNYHYLVYQIPDKWRGDLYYFREGEYSMMSELAKDTIRCYSKLPYRVMTESGETETDVRLLALDRAAVLRDYWERELGAALPRELLPKPKPDMYLDLSTLYTQKGQSH